MFTYAVWEEICRDISQKYKTITINQVLNNLDEKRWIVIKHDVETSPLKALDLAKIENLYGIKATYFVQADLVEDNHKILQEIASLGHEVTYHYDVLDANGGDYKKATFEFQNNLELFKKYGFEVATVCPHGNPLMIRDNWSSNKDFFRKDEIRNLFSDILDVVVELPTKIDYTYISDAGYGFKKIVNIHNNDIKNDGDISLKDYKKLLEVFSCEDRVVFSTHPHRWEKNGFKFLLNVYIFKVLKYIAKNLSKISLFKKIISRYYYLAKKI